MGISSTASENRPRPRPPRILIRCLRQWIQRPSGADRCFSVPLRCKTCSRRHHCRHHQDLYFHCNLPTRHPCFLLRHFPLARYSNRRPLSLLRQQNNRRQQKVVFQLRIFLSLKASNSTSTRLYLFHVTLLHCISIACIIICCQWISLQTSAHNKRPVRRDVAEACICRLQTETATTTFDTLTSTLPS